jgi:hypothetical protein
MVGNPEHAVLVQLPLVVHVAELHVAERVPEYPVAQVGTQPLPLAVGREQVPATEFGIAGRVVHAVLVQLPVVDHVAELHVAEGVPEYPVVQAGAHVVPLDTGREQVPVTEFRIAGAEVQEVLVQVPVVDHDPKLHVAESVPV